MAPATEGEQKIADGVPITDTGENDEMNPEPSSKRAGTRRRRTAKLCTEATALGLHIFAIILIVAGVLFWTVNPPGEEDLCQVKVLRLQNESKTYQNTAIGACHGAYTLVFQSMQVLSGPPLLVGMIGLWRARVVTSESRSHDRLLSMCSMKCFKATSWDLVGSVMLLPFVLYLPYVVAALAVLTAPIDAVWVWLMGAHMAMGSVNQSIGSLSPKEREAYYIYDIVYKAMCALWRVSLSTGLSFIGALGLLIVFAVDLCRLLGVGTWLHCCDRAESNEPSNDEENNASATLSSGSSKSRRVHAKAGECCCGFNGQCFCGGCFGLFECTELSRVVAGSGTLAYRTWDWLYMNCNADGWSRFWAAFRQKCACTRNVEDADELSPDAQPASCGEKCSKCCASFKQLFRQCCRRKVTEDEATLPEDAATVAEDGVATSADESRAGCGRRCAKCCGSCKERFRNCFRKRATVEDTADSALVGTAVALKAQGDESQLTEPLLPGPDVAPAA